MFNYLSYSPISSLKYLCASLAILMQVLNSNLCTCVDYAAGEASIEAGLMAHRTCSVEGTDVFVRASEIYSYVWRMQKDDQELKQQSPTLVIKSRLSASLLYDILWKWRQYHIKGKTLEKTSKDSMMRQIFRRYQLTIVLYKVAQDVVRRMTTQGCNIQIQTKWTGLCLTTVIGFGSLIIIFQCLVPICQAEGLSTMHTLHDSRYVSLLCDLSRNFGIIKWTVLQFKRRYIPAY
jgi:hypothetical protein